MFIELNRTKISNLFENSQVLKTNFTFAWNILYVCVRFTRSDLSFKDTVNLCLMLRL